LKLKPREMSKSRSSPYFSLNKHDNTPSIPDDIVDSDTYVNT